MSDKLAPQQDIPEDQGIEPAQAKKKAPDRETEIGGRKGPEPTRYGDWEKNGLISDF